MEYVRVAIDTPVDSTFDYHVPPELEGRLAPGHLVQVAFGTAMQHAIVLECISESAVEKTKPVIARLDPRPVVTEAQIALSRWMNETYLAPIGACLWIWLPPGLTGHRDILVTLAAEDYASDDPLEQAVIALLKRRGTLRGHQFNLSMPGKAWRAAVDALAKAGVVVKESTLTPPRVKARIIQTAALAIHPNDIHRAARHLERPSRPADLLEVIASVGGEMGAKQAIKLASASKAHLDKLLEAGLVEANGDSVRLTIPADALDAKLIELRKIEKPLRILRVLAREGEPMDVSWVYAQADASLADLKRLEEEELITLGEAQKWRDSLAEREFVATAPPDLTPEQESAWSRIREAVVERANRKTPPPSNTPDSGERSFVEYTRQLTPAPSRIRGGEKMGIEQRGDENYRRWQVPSKLYAKLQPVAHEMRLNPTPAEDRLWQYLRDHQLAGFEFRRQHQIERFIVDFYCGEACLVVEVDGEIHQYSQAEDALRQELLEALGLRVIRFTNDEVLHHVQAVNHQIKQAIREQLKHLAVEKQRRALSRHEDTTHTANERLLPTNQQLAPHPHSAKDSELTEAYQFPTNQQLAPLPHSAKDSELREAYQFSTNQQFAPLPEFGEGSGVGSTFLLHGVTGSGKTEIYLRAIELTLALGRMAIFLVPEIALTAQTVRRVAARFPGRTAVVHSGLSEGERYDTWRRARDGLVQVIVGARSALFTPLKDIGLVILDEEHDSSYKQSPPILPPYYHARDLAIEMMRRAGGVVILGSATPDVETVYRAAQGEIEKLEMPRRIMGHRVRIGEQAERAGVLARYQPATAEDAVMIDLPPVQVVDMRDELKSGNATIFSRPLQYAIADVIEKREQAILFLNRRGQSTYVFCRDCGYVANCPRCDTPLTYHRFGESLRCHRCGHEQAPPVICPQCHSRRIKFFGAGTQQVEQALTDMFPRARVIRWDSDTATSPGAHEVILQRFIDRKADIMVGTQLVAKGLDLPLVTLVGVVSADIGLALPDFRAGERTFQVLTQVAGRAGRGLLGGRVILQTYQPDHYTIQTAAKHDYARFYEREIGYRREIGYPPFRRLVRILFRFPNETKTRAEAERAADMLRVRLKLLDMTGTELIGPAPCFFMKEGSVFRWHLILRGPDPSAALRGVDIPKGWYVDVDPVDVL